MLSKIHTSSAAFLCSQTTASMQSRSLLIQRYTIPSLPHSFYDAMFEKDCGSASKLYQNLLFIHEWTLTLPCTEHFTLPSFCTLRSQSLQSQAPLLPLSRLHASTSQYSRNTEIYKVKLYTCVANQNISNHSAHVNEDLTNRAPGTKLRSALGESTSSSAAIRAPFKIFTVMNYRTIGLCSTMSPI